MLKNNKNLFIALKIFDTMKKNIIKFTYVILKYELFHLAGLIYDLFRNKCHSGEKTHFLALNFN